MFLLYNAHCSHGACLLVLGVLGFIWFSLNHLRSTAIILANGFATGLPDEHSQMPMLLGFKLHALNISHGPATHTIFILSDRFSNFLPISKGNMTFLLLFSLKIYLLSIYAYLCVSVRVYGICLRVLMEVRRRCQIP